MKKSMIIIALFGFLLELVAVDNTQISPTKAQMLLEAKKLMLREDLLKNKKIAWQKRQKVIIDDFNKRNETNEHFGKTNAYGKKRLAKYQRDFYLSLQDKNDALEENLLVLQGKLARVKKQFLRLYARPMRAAEIKGDVIPKAVNKHNKIRILNVYLDSKNSWSKHLKKNKLSDAQRLKIAKTSDMTPFEYKRYSRKITQDMEKNFKELDKYEQISKNAQIEYKTKYGYVLENEKIAKKLLNNIKINHP